MVIGESASEGDTAGLLSSRATVKGHKNHEKCQLSVVSCQLSVASQARRRQDRGNERTHRQLTTNKLTTTPDRRSAIMITRFKTILAAAIVAAVAIAAVGVFAVWQRGGQAKTAAKPAAAADTLIVEPGTATRGGITLGTGGADPYRSGRGRDWPPVPGHRTRSRP